MIKINPDARAMASAGKGTGLVGYNLLSCSPALAPQAGTPGTEGRFQEPETAGWTARTRREAEIVVPNTGAQFAVENVETRAASRSAA